MSLQRYIIPYVRVMRNGLNKWIKFRKPGRVRPNKLRHFIKQCPPISDLLPPFRAAPGRLWEKIRIFRSAFCSAKCTAQGLLPLNWWDIQFYSREAPEIRIGKHGQGSTRKIFPVERRKKFFERKWSTGIEKKLRCAEGKKKYVVIQRT